MSAAPPPVWAGGTEITLGCLSRRAARAEGWEIEIGFGKGRFLLDQASQRASTTFLGIEIASEYFRIARDRAVKRRLDNLILVRGEALALLAAYLPSGLARAIHIYFPDPWPKKRHRRRRLLDPTSIDLVLNALGPDGELYFATDFLEYGHKFRRILGRHPGVRLEDISGVWPSGPRTNYEAKYIAEGRPILRCVAHRVADRIELHPDGAASIACAYHQQPEDPEA